MAMDITGTLGGFGKSALNFAIMIFSILSAAGFGVGLLYVVQKLKRYNQFKCIIWCKDGFGQLRQTYDNAGIFEDKRTKNKRFYIRKAKVGLNPDNVPYIQVGNKKVVYLYETGLKNFHYIKPKIGEEIKGKDKDGKEIIKHLVNLQVGEEDVNWALNAYERAKKTFTSSTLLQYMPFIALGFVSITILIIFIYFFKDFSALRDMSAALKEAAFAIRDANAGTVLLP